METIAVNLIGSTVSSTDLALFLIETKQMLQMIIATEKRWYESFDHKISCIQTICRLTVTPI